MTVDKFGRHISSVFFKKTNKRKHRGGGEEEDYDFKLKRLRNIGDAVDLKDALNMESAKKSFLHKTDNYYDFKFAKLKNVGKPSQSTDAVSLDAILELILYPIYKSIHMTMTEKPPIAFKEFKLLWAGQAQDIYKGKFHNIFDVYFKDIDVNKLSQIIFNESPSSSSSSLVEYKTDSN